MTVINKIQSTMNAVLSVVIIFLFSTMLVVGSYQIITRYFFNAPSTISEELLTFTFAWMSLFATAYVFGKRDHMRMGFLADKLSGKSRAALELAIECLVLAFVVIVMVYGGFSIVNLTMPQATASLGIPMGYVYMAVPVSGVFIVVYNIINIAHLLAYGYEDSEEGVTK